eukprot:CAMPEP_0181330590 /NCGR_PEP_ID=MMETSP1101-20121128/23987_1 /TAXON_ID=46948 /ORGANISM="Rhodomonas abbreviata, Strain Caron Lab Isolate" /LENGTH=596 /DNA_ID=CAMNT_0023439869 /DNA_START=425 /DNA_END=2212 /DNA_ORIENTATION=+
MGENETVLKDDLLYKGTKVGLHKAAKGRKLPAGASVPRKSNVQEPQNTGKTKGRQLPAGASTSIARRCSAEGNSVPVKQAADIVRATSDTTGRQPAKVRLPAIAKGAQPAVGTKGTPRTAAWSLQGAQPAVGATRTPRALIMKTAGSVQQAQMLDKPEQEKEVQQRAGDTGREERIKKRQAKARRDKERARQARSEEEAGGRKPLTVKVLLRKRKQGLWCVAHSDGKYVITVIDKAGTYVYIRCSFCTEADIDYMVSYRWRENCTVRENRTVIAINFMYVMENDKRYWVDSLNHLNDEVLKGLVLAGMGPLYRRRKVVAEYFLYIPNTVKELFQMLMEATRGWMWQEVALGDGVEGFGSNTGRLCFELLRLGRDWHGKAKGIGDERIHWMVEALQWCADRGSVMAEKLENKDSWWTDHSYFGRFSCLLDVPGSSVAAVAAMVDERDERQRILMSAAGNLQNSNIGSPDTWIKPDLITASVAVVSTMPELGGDSEEQEERYGVVFEEIKKGLLQAALSGGCTFYPVACGERRVTNMFEWEIHGVRFVGELTKGERGKYSDGGQGCVEIRTGNGFGDERYTVHIYEAATDWTGEQPGG